MPVSPPITDTLVLWWGAWSRQVRLQENGIIIATYAYDGLTRRTTRATGGITWHTYYSDAWRPWEEKRASQTAAALQYYWGARHRDDLVRRDRATTSGGALDETRYVLMDYFSPAALVDASGNVTERYSFSAFGLRRILNPDFTPRTASESGFDFAFQGQFLDSESGFLNYGYRYYSPHLGRWLSKDPSEEEGGINPYWYVVNSPTVLLDPDGKTPTYPGTKLPYMPRFDPKRPFIPRTPPKPPATPPPKPPEIRLPPDPLDPCPPKNPIPLPKPPKIDF